MAVWDEIKDLSERAQSRSATGAMRHVYESRAKDLRAIADIVSGCRLPNNQGASSSPGKH